MMMCAFRCACDQLTTAETKQMEKRWRNPIKSSVRQSRSGSRMVEVTLGQAPNI